MRRLGVVLVLVAGCKASTGRPPFNSFPEAEHTEIGFNLAGEDETVVIVTDTLAARLKADSIPVSRIKRVDGFLETPWFDAKTLQPTTRRPLGQDVVKVRAWVDPGKPGYSKIEVETVYIPRADPSIPSRELEQPVPADHPVAHRISEMLKPLTEKYGIPPDQQEPKKGAGKAKPAVVADTAAKAVKPAGADSGTTPLKRIPVPVVPAPKPVSPPPAPPPPPPPPASRLGP